MLGRHGLHVNEKKGIRGVEQTLNVVVGKTFLPTYVTNWKSTQIVIGRNNYFCVVPL